MKRPGTYCPYQKLHPATIRLRERRSVEFVGAWSPPRVCYPGGSRSRGDLAEVDGFLAVLLWQEYERTGDARPLETLLAYNIQDVVNLEQMLVLAYNLKIRATRFFAAHAMPPPTAPPTPFKPDGGVVRRLRHSSFW